jgi:hypothetical protein
MINKPLKDIVVADLLQLTENAVQEGLTIEYKAGLVLGTDAEKKEFLADVSSFANTKGGDLIFGIEENQGSPTSISGIAISDIDQEKLRLENMVSSGISPRIVFGIQAVRLTNGKNVLIIRVGQSWNTPHRVIFKGHDKFYARNSSGKYPMDVHQLRTAFNLSSSITEEIRRFKLERLSDIQMGKTFFPLPLGPKIIVHLIPIESFANKLDFGVLPKANFDKLFTISGAITDKRINLEGLINFVSAPNEKGIQIYESCTQYYRNGVIEAVDSILLEKSYIPSTLFEKNLILFLQSCFGFLKELEISAPIIGFVTLIGVKGIKLATGGTTFSEHLLERDVIEFREILVDEYPPELPTKLLRPVFDQLWNAFGLKESPNFNAYGDWGRSA